MQLGRSRYGVREPPGTRLPPVFAWRFSSGGGRRSEQYRGRHGVGVPPVRLRLDLRVQVLEVGAELLRIGREIRTVRTRFSFWHPSLLSESALAASAVGLVLPASGLSYPHGPPRRVRVVAAASRPPPGADRRDRGRPRRPGHQDPGRGGLDPVGLHPGQRRGGRGPGHAAGPRPGAVAGTDHAPDPGRPAHRRGRAARPGLLRAGAQPRGPATGARAGRPGPAVEGDRRAGGRSAPARCLPGRRRVACPQGPVQARARLRGRPSRAGRSPADPGHAGRAPGPGGLRRPPRRAGRAPGRARRRPGRPGPAGPHRRRGRDRQDAPGRGDLRRGPRS